MLAIALFVGFTLSQAGEKLPAEVPVRPEFFQPPTRRPVLSQVSYTAKLTQIPEAPLTTLSMPVPSGYSGQTIISFQVHTEPATALKSWRWRSRGDGLNSMVEVTLHPTTGPVLVTYDARVLTPGEGVIRTQRKDSTAWSGPTQSVPSSDADIIALAAKLKSEAKEQPDFIKSVVRFVALNKVRQTGDPLHSDAKSALRSGGDPLGRANLCAAILRASGVPARTICIMPTWGERADSLSWLTEYWTDDGNWQMVDPSVGLQFPARNSAVILAIPSINDENHVSNLIAERPDAPDFCSPTVTQTAQFQPMGNNDHPHSLHVIKSFPGQSGARLMTAGYRRSLAVITDATQGKASWIEDRLLNHILQKGPINLALYLDGQPTLGAK